MVSMGVQAYKGGLGSVASVSPVGSTPGAVTLVRQSEVAKQAAYAEAEHILAFIWPMESESLAIVRDFSCNKLLFQSCNTDRRSLIGE